MLCPLNIHFSWYRIFVMGISNELKFLSDDQYVETRLVIEKVSNKINALRKKRLSASTPKQLND
jgi:hypothetical protein